MSDEHRSTALTRALATFLLVPWLACTEGSSAWPGDAGLTDLGPGEWKWPVDARTGPDDRGPSIDTPCQPTCAGKNCGDSDGCGGTCPTGSCPVGQRCVAGACICDATSCGKGCCGGNVCFPGTADDHCGAAGQSCVDCLAQGKSCNASQTCIACTPDCAGKACGAPNGCGGTCSTGSCPAGQTCSGGICLCTPQSCPQGCCDPQSVCQTGLEDTACGGGGAPCQDCSAQTKECYQRSCKDCSRWGAALPGRVKGLEVDTDGTIYISGRTPSGILIASLDHCGKVLKSKTHMPPKASKAMGAGLSLSGSSIYLGGWTETSGDRDGFFGQFSKSTFAPAWLLPVGTTGQDEVWDIVKNNATRSSPVVTFWLSGTADFSADPQVTAAMGQSSQKVCPLPSAASGNGRNLALSGSHVYLTGGKSGEGLIARYDKSCTCSTCGTPWTASFKDGSNATEGRDLLLAGGSLYVAGFSVTGSSDVQAAIFRVNPTNGATLGSHTWNPTAAGDYYMSLATDGAALYVAGVKGASGGSGGQAFIRRYSMLLGTGWIREPGDPGAYRNVEVVGGTGLIMAGGDNTGIVRRCLTSGLCP